MKTNSKAVMIGGMLLIAGSCIGVGMLALPVLMGLAGFFPSLIMLLLVFIYMTATGLLFVEINGWFRERVNIVSMARQALGKIGGLLSWVIYLFLFYSLLVAYISGAGNLFSLFAPGFSGMGGANELFILCYVLVFGTIVYLGTRSVDLVNRYLMVGLIFSYVAMISLGVTKIDPHLLTFFQPKNAWIALPILVTSFGFQNMIPSLTTYLKGDLRKMRWTVIGGSIIALLVYFTWILFFLGTVPAEGKWGLIQGLEEQKEAVELLQHFVDFFWIKTFSKWFAFFAITTSFLAQSLGLVHFIADGVHVELTKKNKWILLFVTLLPPTCFGLFYPGIFFQALGFAGGICAVILFGFFPVIIAYLGRYHKKILSPYQLGGGKGALFAIFAFSLILMICEIMNLFSKSF